MLFFTLPSKNFTKVRLTFLSMATFVEGCACFGVHHTQIAYLPAFHRTRNWSKRNSFDYGISLDNPELQLKTNSGGYKSREVVPVT